MKYIAAYMLAKLGKENPTNEDLQRIIESVGIEFDHKKADEIINKLTGKDINEVIEDGKSNISVVSKGSTSRPEQQKWRFMKIYRIRINDKKKTRTLYIQFDKFAFV